MPNKYAIEGRVFTVEDPILRQVGAPIIHFTPELSHLFKQMQALMESHDGIGIAAQQVGLAFRCCFIDVRPCDNLETIHCIFDGTAIDDVRTILPLRICNPVIEATHGLAPCKEGCLSVPGFSADVSRPEVITSTFFDEKGAQHHIECDGILARCMLHEFDHLDGIVFIDHLSSKDAKKYQRFLQNQQEKAKDDRP
ncbi:MAG: peptide deformylase [Opitutales bacterium]|nr:peptide deformylase [Opitutales bacterium]